MSLKIFIPLLAVAALLSADTLILRDGRMFYGTYLGGDSREVRMAVGDRVQTYDVNSVRRIEFGAGSAQAAPEPAPAVPERRLLRAQSEPAVARTAGTVEIPGGTNFVVRLIDNVDSERDSVGQTYRASVDEPIMIDGNTVIPRGADAVVKLVDDQESGRVSGKTVLTLDLMAVTVNGRPVEIDTRETTAQSGSRSARTGKLAGGTAALGAIIGAIAGGGRGAAIGAASGAGVGTAASVIVKGPTVKIPSESRLSFALRQNVRI